MGTCLGCGAPLAKRHQKKYCSNKCQHESRQQALLARWLETGDARPQAAPRHYIRAYVLVDQGGVCVLCGSPGEWMGAPLTFVMDHIDGNSDNNRRENLRLVCPNCDSQLPMFKARNKGNGRHWRRERYANGQSY